MWIAAPLTGCWCSRSIGYISDRTWTSARPARAVFPIGAVLAASALWLMPRAPTSVVRGCIAVDAGCLDQCVDGAVPRLRRRPAGAGAATDGLRHAKLLHWNRCGRGERAALDPGASRVQQHAAAAANGLAMIPDTVRMPSTPGRRCCCSPSCGPCCARGNILRRNCGSFSDAVRCRGAFAACAGFGALRRGVAVERGRTTGGRHHLEVSASIGRCT